MGVFGNKPQQGGPPPVRSAMAGAESWVLRAEEGIMRLVSLIFSVGSAYAIARVFAPTTDADMTHTVMDWLIAGGFGVLGYFLSRNIAYRLMRKEPVWLYIPICLIVELVEIFCNYVIGVSDVAHASWLLQVPVDQRAFLSMVADFVLSIIPAVTLTLAVAEMDLEKRKTDAKTGVVAPVGARPAVQPNRGMQAPAPRPAPAGAMRPNGQPQPVQQPAGPPPGVRPAQPMQPQPVGVS
jgi:hypothetical protein